MKAVAVKELKNRLSQYLREVASGEVVLVTDRGKVVAELLVLGLPQDSRAYRRTRATLRRPSQTLLDAERAQS